MSTAAAAAPPGFPKGIAVEQHAHNRSPAHKASFSDEQHKRANSSTSQSAPSSSSAKQVVGKYELGKSLAVGDFDCRTRLCTHIVTGATYVVRIYAKALLAEAEWMWSRVRSSIHVQRTLPKHENVVEMMECFETPTSLYILMQLFPSENLVAFIKEAKERRKAAGGALTWGWGHASTTAALTSASSNGGNGNSSLTNGVDADEDEDGVVLVDDREGDSTSGHISFHNTLHGKGSRVHPLGSPSSAPSHNLRADHNEEASDPVDLLRQEDVSRRRRHGRHTKRATRRAETSDADNDAGASRRGGPHPNDAGEDKRRASRPRGVPVSMARCIFEKVVRGLLHMHAHSVCHLGIAPDHILINVEKGQVKISNLISCCFCPRGRRMTDLRGTRHTVAPEVLRKEPYDPYLADAWSLGVLLYFILNDGYYPHDGANTLKHILYAHTRPCDPSVPAPAQDLIARLLQPKPSERLCVEAILLHPFMAGVASPSSMGIRPHINRSALARGRGGPGEAHPTGGRGGPHMRTLDSSEHQGGGGDAVDLSRYRMTPEAHEERGPADDSSDSSSFPSDHNSDSDISGTSEDEVTPLEDDGSEAAEDTDSASSSSQDEEGDDEEEQQGDDVDDVGGAEATRGGGRHSRATQGSMRSNSVLQRWESTSTEAPGRLSSGHAGVGNRPSRCAGGRASSATLGIADTDVSAATASTRWSPRRQRRSTVFLEEAASVNASGHQRLNTSTASRSGSVMAGSSGSPHGHQRDGSPSTGNNSNNNNGIFGRRRSSLSSGAFFGTANTQRNGVGPGSGSIRGGQPVGLRDAHGHGSGSLTSFDRFSADVNGSRHGDSLRDTPQKKPSSSGQALGSAAVMDGAGGGNSGRTNSPAGERPEGRQGAARTAAKKKKKPLPLPPPPIAPAPAEQQRVLVKSSWDQATGTYRLQFPISLPLEQQAALVIQYCYREYRRRRRFREETALLHARVLSATTTGGGIAHTDADIIVSVGAAPLTAAGGAAANSQRKSVRSLSPFHGALQPAQTAGASSSGSGARVRDGHSPSARRGFTRARLAPLLPNAAGGTAPPPLPTYPVAAGAAITATSLGNAVPIAGGTPLLQNAHRIPSSSLLGALASGPEAALGPSPSASRNSSWRVGVFSAAPPATASAGSSRNAATTPLKDGDGDRPTAAPLPRFNLGAGALVHAAASGSSHATRGVAGGAAWGLGDNGLSLPLPQQSFRAAHGGHACHGIGAECPVCHQSALPKRRIFGKPYADTHYEFKAGAFVETSRADEERQEGGET